VCVCVSVCVRVCVGMRVCVCVLPYVCVCDLTHSRVCRDSLMYVSWLRGRVRGIALLRMQ